MINSGISCIDNGRGKKSVGISERLPKVESFTTAKMEGQMKNILFSEHRSLDPHWNMEQLEAGLLETVLVRVPPDTVGSSVRSTSSRSHLTQESGN